MHYVHTQLSDRINALPSSATLTIAHQTQLLKQQGQEVIDLSIGEPDCATPLFIQQAAKQAIDAGTYFTYPPVAGYPDLREAIANKLKKDNQLTYTPEQIIVSTGAKQALFNVFFSLLNPGDEVIIYTPYWPSYRALIQLAGGIPVCLKGEPTHNFAITPEQLSQTITPKTKAVLFSSPSNPTGLILSQQALQELATVLTDHPHIWVVADEIYEYIHFTETFTSIGALAHMQDRTITINGFSKSFAMTGWRVGYLAAPLALAKACEKIQGQTTTATCSIAQRAALAALEAGKTTTDTLKQTYLTKRNQALQLLHDIPHLSVPIPDGAFYLFPNVSAYWGTTDGKKEIHNAEDLCQYLLQEAHVALVPGTSFGEPQCIRLSYAASDKQIENGIQQIKTALARLSYAL